MLFAGLDLAGVETRPSGFAVLDEFLNAETTILYTDSEVLRDVSRLNPIVVAIDAPLSLPKGRSSLEVKSDIHLRVCDRELLKRGIKFFPITLGPMRSLTKRGIRLRKVLQASGFRVIEVYPGGAQDILGIPRKSSGISRLRRGLAHLGIKGLDKVETHHELDAVTAALVGKMFYEGNYEAYGDPDEGLIVMPIGRNRI